MEFDGIRLLESAFLMLRNLQGRESKIVLVRLILKSKIMFIFSYHSNKKSSSYMDDMGRKCECPGGMSRKSRPMEKERDWYDQRGEDCFGSQWKIGRRDSEERRPRKKRRIPKVQIHSERGGRVRRGWNLEASLNFLFKWLKFSSQGCGV